MKKFKCYFFLSICIIVLVSNCDNDNTKVTFPKPELKIISQSGFLQSEQDSCLSGNYYSIKMQALYNGQHNLKSLEIVLNEAVFRKINISDSLLSYTFEINHLKDTAKFDNWIFTVHDSVNNFNSVIITVRKDNTGKKLTDINSIVIGAQQNTSFGSFLLLPNAKTVFLNQAYEKQDSVHVLCYYNPNDNKRMCLGSPAGNIAAFFSGENSPQNWLIRNETMFCKIIVTDSFFHNIERDTYLHTLYNNSDKIYDVTNLAFNQFLLIKTSDDKLGILKILHIDGMQDGLVRMQLKISN